VKRWLPGLFCLLLTLFTLEQVMMSARMPCGAGHSSAAATADAATGHVAQAAQHADAAQSPCHDSGAKDCSDVCKRLCSNVAFVPQTVADSAFSVMPSRVRPPMSAPLFTRASPPDTPPPIA
jgi:hypothetical protein